MKKLVFFGTFLLTPMFAFAQSPIRDVDDLGQQLIDIVNNVLVPLLFTLAFLMFIWGIFQYFIAGGADEEKRKSGQQLIIYGIIGFALMVSVWGLVNLLTTTFNFGKNVPRIPATPGTR